MNRPPAKINSPPGRGRKPGDPLIWAAPLLIAAALLVLLLMFWLGTQTDGGADQGIPPETGEQPVSGAADAR